MHLITTSLEQMARALTEIISNVSYLVCKVLLGRGVWLEPTLDTRVKSSSLSSARRFRKKSSQGLEALLR